MIQIQSIWLVVLVLFSAPGCGKPQDSTTSPEQDSKHERELGLDSSKKIPPEPSANESMSTDFSNALARFQKYASERLKKKPSELDLLPSDESGVMPSNQGHIGSLVRFQAREKGTDGSWLSAWAGPTAVVTPEQNLGILFKEAGVWSSAPKLSAQELAEQIVWGLEPTMRVITGGVYQSPAPSLVLDEKGNGQLTFAVGMRELGPGGAGGGPEKIGNSVVTLSGDQSAMLKTTWIR